MFGASEFAAYSQSQAQAAQAEGYALGQQDSAYVFYGVHDPFTAAPQHEDPCFSTQDQGAPPSSDENEFAMFARGRAAQLGQQFRNQAFVHGFRFGLDYAILQDDPGEYEKFFPHPPTLDAHVLSTPTGTQGVHCLHWRGQGLPPLPHSSFDCKNSSSEFPWKIKSFSPFCPDLSVITEDESKVCGWPEDTHDIAVDVAENFTRPGLLSPVRGGGNFWWKTMKVVLHSIPSFILQLLSSASWIDAGTSVASTFSHFVPPLRVALRAPRTPALFSTLLVLIMVLSFLSPAAGSSIAPRVNSASFGFHCTNAVALAAFGISSSTADTGTYFIDLGCTRTICCN
eukprot:3030194-Rhodomonas_salina.1